MEDHIVLGAEDVVHQFGLFGIPALCQGLLVSFWAFAEELFDSVEHFLDPVGTGRAGASGFPCKE